MSIRCVWCSEFAIGLDEDKDPQCVRCLQSTDPHASPYKALQGWLESEGLPSVEQLAERLGTTLQTVLDRVSFLGLNHVVRERFKGDRRSTRKITVGKVTRSLYGWSETTGLPASTIFRRLNHGLSAEQAIQVNK